MTKPKKKKPAEQPVKFVKLSELSGRKKTALERTLSDFGLTVEALNGRGGPRVFFAASKKNLLNKTAQGQDVSAIAMQISGNAYGEIVQGQEEDENLYLRFTSETRDELRDTLSGEAKNQRIAGVKKSIRGEMIDALSELPYPSYFVVTKHGVIAFLPSEKASGEKAAALVKKNMTYLKKFVPVRVPGLNRLQLPQLTA